MELVKKYNYLKLNSMLLGNIVNFTSDCEFFPNFNTTGKVINIEIKNSEIIFKVLINKKEYKIGSNMRNLKFKIIQ